MKYLIKQATLLPLIFFAPVLVAGFLVPNYSSISQHASEITITEFESAKMMINSGAICTGLSCLILSIGILLNFRRHTILSLLIALFGLSMISNGIYPMGTIMHGFYGIGITIIIIPFIACYELINHNRNKTFFTLSLISGFAIFIYMWSMLVGLDPANYRGLTQRIASIFIFGWFAYFAYELTKMLSNNVDK